MEDKELTNTEIGERLKAARLKKGINMNQLAKTIHVACSTIKRYEDGGIENIKIPIIASIAKALDVNPMWIIGKSESALGIDNDSYKIDFEIYNKNEKMMIEMIRKLDESGRKTVEAVIKLQYERVRNNGHLLAYNSSMKDLRLNDGEGELLAANSKENQTPEGIEHDLNLLFKK